MGYIEEIIPEENYMNKETQRSFNILKFILNNNSGIRIQCNAYNENIDIFKEQIKILDVIYFYLLFS